MILRLFRSLIETAPTLGAGLDWKSSLQELTAARGMGAPSYVVTATGPDHDKEFTATVVVMNTEYGRGVGRTKKEAELKAAAAAWTALSRHATSMPELPEVEVVRRGLEAHVAGKTITAVRVHHPRAVRRHEAGPADLTARLLNMRITGTGRRGKYLWLTLDDDSALVVHLGMSGQMLLGPVPNEGHLRIAALLDDGTALSFVDQRTFGGWMLTDVVTVDGTDVPVPVAHIARDPLDPEFNRDGVVKVLRRKHSEIKRQLLDQTVVSGIGNIYADEALWRAKINGARLASSLTRKQLGELLDTAAEVMTEALGAGRHVVRLVVCQRQRRVRLLRPVAGRLRTRGRAVPALRRGDATGEVHEPVVVLLPEMPTPPASPPVLTPAKRNSSR